MCRSAAGVCIISEKAAKHKIWGVAKAKGKAKAAAEGPKPAPAEAGDWDGELVGSSCRCIDDALPALFAATAKIMQHKQGELFVQLDTLPHLVKLQLRQVDLLPQLLPTAKPKALQLNKTEKTELFWKFPMCEDLVKAGRLTGDHIMLGWWLACRDIQAPTGAYLVPPMVAAAYCESLIDPAAYAAESKLKAAELLRRRFKAHGLLGIPVWSENGGAGCEHWTLLVVRRFAGMPTQVRYYDSLTEMSPFNKSRAEVLLQELVPEHGELSKANKARQMNGYDCGAFVLYWWEGEARRFRGEGWPLEFPSSQLIAQRKGRLISVVTALRKFYAEQEAEAEADAVPGAKKKKQALAVEFKAKEDDDVTSIKEADLKLMELEKLATQAKDQGSELFYGCSRCRWSRGGCINWQCHPEKWKLHQEKFPDKYQADEKTLLTEISQRITNAELVGGGCQVSCCCCWWW